MIELIGAYYCFGAFFTGLAYALYPSTKIKFDDVILLMTVWPILALMFMALLVTPNVR